MSTDETAPRRQQPTPSPDQASQAPTEAHPTFEPAPSPAQQPAFQPARPRFTPGGTAEPAYHRSAEPQTVQSETLRPTPAQAEQSPRPSYGKPPSGPAGEYGETAQYEQTAPYNVGGQYGAPPADAPQYGSAQQGSYGSGSAQYGSSEYGSSEYGSSQYGQESGYDDQPPVPRAGQRRPRRRKRRIIMSVFVVAVVLILLVISDFVAKAVAENEIADQITSADPQIHPSVTIQGFPFLTQVATRDLREIDISASNVQAGPVTITSISAAAKGIHINGGFNGGEVDSISGTVFIAFGSLSDALSNQSQGIANISLTAAGPSSIKASFGVLGANVLTQTGTVTFKGNTINIAWSQSGGNDSGGIIGSVLGNSGTLPDLSFPLPKLPAGLQVKSFSVTSSGVSLTVAAQHTTLSQ